MTREALHLALVVLRSGHTASASTFPSHCRLGDTADRERGGRAHRAGTHHSRWTL